MDKRTNDQIDETYKTATTAVQSGAAALGDAASKAAEGARDTARNVADRLKQSAAGDIGERVASMAEDATGQLDRAADYVRDSDPEDMWDDLVSLVRSRPVQSMAAAVVLGFLIGRVARRM